MTKCDERAKQATKFGKVVIIENRRKCEATKLEAAKVEALLYSNYTTLKICFSQYELNMDTQVSIEMLNLVLYQFLNVYYEVKQNALCGYRCVRPSVRLNRLIFIKFGDFCKDRESYFN